MQVSNPEGVDSEKETETENHLSHKKHFVNHTTRLFDLAVSVVGSKLPRGMQFYTLEKNSF